MDNLQRIPPYDAQAELAVLSCMISDRESVAVAMETIKDDDFYMPNYKAIFNAMSEMFVAGVPIDVVTLTNKLTEKGIFEQIGGIESIKNIAGAFYTSAHIKEYAKIIEEKSILRRLIKSANDTQALSYEAKEDVGAIIEKAEKAIFDIAQKRNTRDFVHIRDILVDAVAKIEETYLSKAKITGLATGFIDFDNRTAGLQPSDLVLFACRPSMGKTAFALNVISHAAVNLHVPVALFSLEMSKEQIVGRLLSAEAMVDAQKLRTGELEDSDWIKIVEAMEPLSKADLYIDDTPGISVSELRAKCRKLKLEKGLGLIVVDYLQLMSGNTRTESRQQEISDISRSLKAVAKELSVPVFACAQVSRACEARKDHRPMLSDLRESGAIEQDADLVAFLYRDEYYFPDTEKKNQAEIIIAKQRNGPTGTVELTYLGQYTKFVNMAKDSMY